MLHLKRMIMSYCRIFNGRCNKLKLIAILILFTILVSASLFHIFLNDESSGSVPQVARIKYRHRFQQVSTRNPDWGEHVASRAFSDRRTVVRKHAPLGNRLLHRDVNESLSVARIREYCNVPLMNATGEEGEAPPGYRLVNVQVMIRHGTRSPMYSFTNHHNPQLSCKFDNAAKSNNLIRSFIGAMKTNERRQNPNSPFFRWLLYPQRKLCGPSELMPSGSMQHVLNGFHFHEKYVRKWRLFGESFRGEQVHVVSTLYSRTYQSSIAFLYSFLPRFYLNELNIEQTSNLFCDERFVHSSCSCPALHRLKETVNVESLQFNRNNTRLFRLQKYIGNVFGLKPQQLPTMWAMMDVFMGYACNKVKPLPCNSNRKCIQPWVIAELWDLLDGYGVKLNNLKSYQRYSQVTMHPFLAKVLEQMNLSIKNRTKVKFSLFSGHDTTITPLAVTLGIHDGKWPHLASRIVFELYSQVGQKDRHYVKVLYNGRNITPDASFCQGHVINGMCKLKYFTRFVREEILQGKTYAHICHTNM
ncbi:2-phosphoxylose phosphatase 1-like [Gigantopelta aegis]|uniref:2-phosphoxylose phosphatase 1-like n=1 Tax=Gigantopelta aegis TaxID=1735272 RepID=UPI001B88B636|nr:2-phosphoxylose phosphatase 1-like [Gigantopelta aegis]